MMQNDPNFIAKANPNWATGVATPKKKKGTFLTSLIPTLGGSGGALAGGAAGAALGSVVPGLGTAIGGLVGALIGGAGGSAGGKVLQNSAEGEADLGKGVAGEALLGGVTSLPIGSGLKLAGAGIKALGGVGSKAAVNTAVKATGGTAAKTSLAGRLRTLGDNALTSQYGTISKPFARSTDPKATISTLAGAGITKPADAERIASAITGGSGIITKATADAVGTAKGVNTSGLDEVLEQAISNNGLVDADAKSVRQIFKAQMGKLNGGPAGSLATGADPDASIGVIRALEKRIANLSGKGDNYRLSTPERLDQAAVLKLVRDELEDRLFVGAGANGGVASALTPKVRDTLTGLFPDNPKWTQYVDDNIFGSKTVDELRSSVAPFVKVGKIIDEGERNAMTFGGRVGNAFAGGGNGLLDTLGGAATNVLKNPAARVAGTTLRTAADLVGGSGAKPAVRGLTDALAGVAGTQGVVPLIARQGGSRIAVNALTDPESDAGAMPIDPTIQPGFTTNPAGTLDQTATTPPEEQENPFGASSADFAQAYTKALAAGDEEAAAQLKQLYALSTDWESSQQAPGLGSLSATTGQALATSSNGLSTLDQLEGLFQQAGSGGGQIGGRVQTFLGNAGLDDNAAAYTSLAESATSQLAKAINGSGTVSDADAAALIKALPQLTDNPRVAAAKFAALRARLQGSQSNALLYGGGISEE
ncbi:hypothetical protein [Naasia lichenicola]|uniref:Uncharacterized protein n=1 Tax=Naasia lichenicola TaxID=2565933 RepID=A0A4S4FN85_9MICO|nr:hypothetical protein [Naasia lichenicola]THG30672.1 hypothetical protein E6C64_08510 [Naasia lichenicola]THG31909.1 hypothetical protein E6C64_07655 [Naasia lichenicola]